MTFLSRFALPSVFMLAALAAVYVLFGPFAALCVAVALLTYAYVPFGRARWVPVVLLLLAVLAPAIGFAADGTTPETVAQATGEGTKITWAYGAVIQQWSTAIGTLILAGVTWALRLLPAQIYGILVSLRADQLLGKAIDYAINMVKGASKDKELSIDVHNEVLAKALQYVLDNAPGWLQSWMGGPEQIANKIIARLNIATDALPLDVQAAVASTSAPGA